MRKNSLVFANDKKYHKEISSGKFCFQREKSMCKTSEVVRCLSNISFKTPNGATCASEQTYSGFLFPFYGYTEYKVNDYSTM